MATDKPDLASLLGRCREKVMYYNLCLRKDTHRAIVGERLFSVPRYNAEHLDPTTALILALAGLGDAKEANGE